MVRRAPPEKRAVLDGRRVYILPTKSGLFFALILFLMLTGSINYSLSLGFALTFLLSGIAAVSIYHAYADLVDLVIEPGGSAPVHAGERAVFGIRLSGGSRARRGICLVSGEGERCYDIPPGETVAAEVGVHARKRGWLEAGRFTLRTVHPLGLFRAWSYVELAMFTLVYPKPAERAEHPGGGEVEGRPVPGREDFSGLRPYRPGDAPRHIAWKSLASRDALQVKAFEAPRGRDALWLDWDDVGGDVEARLSKLARMALDAGGMTFGLRLPGKVIPPGSGRVQLLRALEALALFEP